MKGVAVSFLAGGGAVSTLGRLVILLSSAGSGVSVYLLLLCSERGAGGQGMSGRMGWSLTMLIHGGGWRGESEYTTPHHTTIPHANRSDWRPLHGDFSGGAVCGQERERDTSMTGPCCTRKRWHGVTRLETGRMATRHGLGSEKQKEERGRLV